MSSTPRKFTPKSPGKGVHYLNHFPKYFLRPYGQVEDITPSILENRLAPINCEWFHRPEVAVSELADTVLHSTQRLTESQSLIQQNTWTKIKTKLDPFLAACKGLNKNETETPLTDEHFDTFMKTMTNNTLTDPLADDLYQTGHAMMVMGLHLKISKHVITHPHFFATHSKHENNLDDKLKHRPNAKHVRQYLKNTLHPSTDATATTSSSTSTARRNLMDILDDADDDTDTHSQTSNTVQPPTSQFSSGSDEEQEMQPPPPTLTRRTNKKRKPLLHDSEDEEEAQPLPVSKKTKKKKKKTT